VRAVDTNILARYYLHDDAVQGRIAADLLAAGDVFVPKTVILELEWVLRYVADQREDKVIECLAHLIALVGITVEDRDEIEAALATAGMELICRCAICRQQSMPELLT
jgi:predicted nucleic-acid-binding protein